MNSSPEWTVISRGFNTDDPQTVSEKQIIKYIRSETIAGGAQVCHEHTTRNQWMPLSETYLNEYVKQVQRSKDLHQIETKEIAKRKKRVSIAEQRAQDSETRAQEAELRSRNAEERANEAERKANEAERKANEAERKANEAQTSVNDESFATSQEPPRVVSKSIPKMAMEIKPTISDVNSPIEAKKRSVVFWVIVCVLSVAFFGTFGYIRQNRQFHDKNIQYWKTNLDQTHHDYVRALDRISNSNNVTTEMLKESNALHEKWLLTQKHYVDALNDASK
jgi:hypothetical protein